MKKILTRALAMALAALSGSSPALELVRYVIPRMESDMTSGPDGNFWYLSDGVPVRVTKDGHSLAFPVADDFTAVDITFGADGNLWTVSGQTLYAITTSGAIAHTFPLSTNYSYEWTAAAPDGRIWIATTDTHNIHSITAVDTEGRATTYPLGNDLSFHLFRPITAGPDGNLWIAADTQILRVAASGSVTPFDLAHDARRTSGSIVAGPDGKMWLSANDAGCGFSPCIQFGAALISASVDGTTTVYPVPDSGNSSALAMVFGADGNPWLLESRINSQTGSYETALLRRTSNGAFTAYLVEDYVRWMSEDSDGNLWFGYEDQLTKVVIPPDLVFSDSFDPL